MMMIETAFAAVGWQQPFAHTEMLPTHTTNRFTKENTSGLHNYAGGEITGRGVKKRQARCVT